MHGSLFEHAITDRYNLMCSLVAHDIISVGSCMCYKIFKQTSMQPWIDGCVIPRNFIQSILMITFFYFIFNLIVIYDYPRHTHMIKYCIQNKSSDNFFYIFQFLKNKPVAFLLIAWASNLSLSSIEINSNIANAFNNEGVIPLFGYRILAVCSIMVRKGNHWIVSLIVVGQYKLLPWRSISSF